MRFLTELYPYLPRNTRHISLARRQRLKQLLPSIVRLPQLAQELIDPDTCEREYHDSVRASLAYRDHHGWRTITYSYTCLNKYDHQDQRLFLEFLALSPYLQAL